MFERIESTPAEPGATPEAQREGADMLLQTQASEELEITCPRGVQAVIDVRYTPGVGEREVTCCSLFEDGPVRCSQPCVRP